MKCRECNGILKVESTIVYCTRCGNVVDDAPIDFGKEWREFSEIDVRKRRTGAPITNFDITIGSTFDRKDKRIRNIYVWSKVKGRRIWIFN